jgi:hypothetical protein
MLKVEYIEIFGKIIHAFIESGMIRNFNVFTFEIKVDDIVGGIRAVRNNQEQFLCKHDDGGSLCVFLVVLPKHNNQTFKDLNIGLQRSADWALL